MRARDFKQMGLDLPASFAPIFLGDELRKPFVARSDLGFGCHAMQRWKLQPLSSDWQFGFAKAGSFPANSRRVPEQGQDSARPSFRRLSLLIIVRNYGLYQFFTDEFEQNSGQLNLLGFQFVKTLRLLKY